MYFCQEKTSVTTSSQMMSGKFRFHLRYISVPLGLLTEQMNFNSILNRMRLGGRLQKSCVLELYTYIHRVTGSVGWSVLHLCLQAITIMTQTLILTSANILYCEVFTHNSLNRLSFQIALSSVSFRLILKLLIKYQLLLL